MIYGETVLTLVPARGGSKGLPGKNTMELHGRPLLGWPVQAALNSKYPDRVIVSTNDPGIARVAKEQGAEVPFLRPDELAGDETGSFAVIEHAIHYCMEEGNNYRYLVYLEPTSPLTETADVDSALELLASRREAADSIVGISKVISAHPQFCVKVTPDQIIAPYSIQNTTVLRRQEIDELFFFDGSLYIADIEKLLIEKTFYHDRTLGYITPKWKSIEIDDLVDFICAEAIMRNRRRLVEEN